jgi:3-deoxy-D-manno-octulosonate 8-phosphate phosphatase (KDO 8-P phosphatase)
MSYLEKLHEIKHFIFDVDGVMTDGTVLVQEDGSLLRLMNSKDGWAIKHAIKKGYDIFIITGGRSKGVLIRLINLGVPDSNIIIFRDDKLNALKELVHSSKIDLSKTVFMGDDIPDYAAMRLVNLAACPKDAIQEIKNISQYISPFDGGKGCVRDIIEKVLKVQNNWFDLDIIE